MTRSCFALFFSAAVLPVLADARPPTGARLAVGGARTGATITQTFGTVTAVAPREMTVPNERNDRADLFKGIDRMSAFALLAGSLDDGQWRKLTSPTGLAWQDLISEAQRQEFGSLFPGPAVRAAPNGDTGAVPADQAVDITADIPQTCLRLVKTSVLRPTDASGQTLFVSVLPPPESRKRWRLVTTEEPTPSRQTAPTALKPSDLDEDRAELHRQIALRGLSTLGDLVRRIRQVSGLEIDADPRYASQPLSVQGDRAFCGDLLRAAAFSVMGTYRKVGSAYVLTDELVGAAVIRARREDQEEELERRRRGMVSAASLYERRSPLDLPDAEDPLAPSHDQTAARLPFAPTLPEFASKMPFSRLTPGQQEEARWIAAHAPENRRVVLTGRWEVSPNYRLEALVPTLPVPVELASAPLAASPFFPSDAFMEEAVRRENSSRELTRPIHWGTKARGRRALLAQPHSLEEIKTLIAAMRSCGFQELWLVVFHDGIARLPGTPFPMSGSGLGGSADLLTEAVGAARGSGITVIPVIDLLTWGDHPPEALRDLTLSGESFSAVSPLEPGTESRLKGLLNAVIQHPGIGGVACRTVAPPGYRGGGDGGGERKRLGYTVTARLAFLRMTQTDPWDIDSQDSGSRAALRERWEEFRRDADQRFLTQLAQEVRSGRPAVPLWLEQDQGSLYRYVVWQNLTQRPAPLVPQEPGPDDPGPAALPPPGSGPALTVVRASDLMTVRDPAQVIAQAENDVGAQGLALDAAGLDPQEIRRLLSP